MELIAKGNSRTAGCHIFQAETEIFLDDEGKGICLLDKYAMMVLHGSLKMKVARELLARRCLRVGGGG